MSLFESDYVVGKTHGQSSQFASITIAWGSDCLDFLGFSTEDVVQFSKAISLTWNKGIQKEQHQADYIRIKLCGRPWDSGMSTNSNLVNSRKMMCALLAALYDRNWVLHFPFSNKGNEHSKDTLMFKSQSTNDNRHWFAIQFLKDDTFCIINATPGFSDTVVSKLGSLVQKQSHDPDALILKLFGWPFSSKESARNSMVEILLMEAIVSQSCEVYASINMMTSDYPRDTWICCTT